MLPQIFSKKSNKNKITNEEKNKIAVSSNNGQKHIFKNYLLSCAGSVSTALVFIFSAKAIGIYVINHFLSNQIDKSVYTSLLISENNYSIQFYLCLAFIFSCLSFFFPYIQTLSSRNQAVLEENYLRKKILKHLFDLGSIDNTESKTGAMLSTLIDGSEKVSYYLQTFFGQVFASFSVPVLSVFLISIFIDPFSGIVLLLCIPLVPIIVGLFQKAFRKVSSKSRNERVRLAGQYLEAIQGIVTLRLLNAHKFKEEELARYGEKNRKAIMELLASNQLIIFVVDSVFSLFAVTTSSILAMYRLSTGSITLDSALALIFVSIIFMEPLDQAAAFFYVGMGGMASKRKIQEILRIKTYKDLQEDKSTYITNVGLKNNSIIKAENLYFKYDLNSENTILENLNFEIYKGERIAIIGSSGNGKSTLIKLLKGYLLPSNGIIQIKNSISTLENIDLIRSYSAYVSQNTWLFNMSIKENLYLANPNATDEQMWQALEKAYISEEIKRLPEGINTIVGEQGISISGGQAQRISLARAFLSDREIIILDEPTSQVDLISEEKILQAIENISEDKTLIMVTHRHNNLKKINRVFIVENKKITIKTDCETQNFEKDFISSEVLEERDA